MSTMKSVEKNDTSLFLPRPYSEADFDDYHAAPLLIVGARARSDLIASQDQLALRFADVVKYEIGEYVRPPIVDFVTRSIVTRMQQREGLNAAEYAKRLYRIPRYASVPGVDTWEAFVATRKSLVGGGTVRQNEIARRTHGMAAGELANLTIIGDFRKYLEPPMWGEVSELMGKDATPEFESMYNLEVVGFDRDVSKSEHVGAMRVGMKRIIGTLDDGAVVKSRTTAIVNTRPSSLFYQSDVHDIRDAYLDKEINIAEVPAFRKVVRWLVEEKLSSDIVLARNETVYAYNKTTHDEISTKRGYSY